MPAAAANASRSSRNAGDLRDDVVVAGIVPASCAAPAHVHEHRYGARVGDDAGQLGIAAQRGHVVDELGAGARARARATSAFDGVDRDRHAAGAARSITGTTRAQLLVERDARRRPGRVVSPPTSTIAAPSSTIRRPRAIAAAAGRGTRRRPRTSRA